jgi:hypothetical protein
MSSVTGNSVTTVTARVYVGATPGQVWEAIVDPAWTARYGYRCPVSYELEAGGAFSAAPGEEMRAMGAGDVIKLQDAPVTAALVSGSMAHTGGAWPWMLSDLKMLVETGSALGA